jgi:hypothetical protein
MFVCLFVCLESESYMVGHPHMPYTGCLFVAEAGSVNGQPRVLTPHPDFRLILALDPRHGEVSAMWRGKAAPYFPNTGLPCSFHRFVPCACGRP